MFINSLGFTEGVFPYLRKSVNMHKLLPPLVLGMSTLAFLTPTLTDPFTTQSINLGISGDHSPSALNANFAQAQKDTCLIAAKFLRTGDKASINAFFNKSQTIKEIIVSNRLEARKLCQQPNLALDIGSDPKTDFNQALAHSVYSSEQNSEKSSVFAFVIHDADGIKETGAYTEETRKLITKILSKRSVVLIIGARPALLKRLEETMPAHQRLKFCPSDSQSLKSCLSEAISTARQL